MGTTASEDLPDWAQIAAVPKRPPRIQKSEKIWREEFSRPVDSIRFDRDAATSKEAPDFFHIEGVPRAQLNSYVEKTATATATAMFMRHYTGYGRDICFSACNALPHNHVVVLVFTQVWRV